MFKIKTSKWTASVYSRLKNRPLCFLKRGLDRASKSCEFVKENKSMTPCLDITMLVLEVASDFRTVFGESVIDEFAQNDLAILQFSLRQVFIVVLFFAIILIDRYLTFLSIE